ncbi:hypothetical protein LJD47_31735, partial [Escherichia coli]|nr:hypothetical protein [Escherichia coli]
RGKRGNIAGLWATGVPVASICARGWDRRSRVVLLFRIVSNIASILEKQMVIEIDAPEKIQF